MHLIYDNHKTKFTILFTVISYVRVQEWKTYTFKTNEPVFTVCVQRKLIVKQSSNKAYRKIIY